MRDGIAVMRHDSRRTREVLDDGKLGDRQTEGSA